MSIEPVEGDHPDVAILKLTVLLLEAGATAAEVLPELRRAILRLETEEGFLQMVLRQQRQVQEVTAQAIALADARILAAEAAEALVHTAAAEATAKAQAGLQRQLQAGQAALLETAGRVIALSGTPDGQAN